MQLHPNVNTVTGSMENTCNPQAQVPKFRGNALVPSTAAVPPPERDLMASNRLIGRFRAHNNAVASQISDDNNYSLDEIDTRLDNMLAQKTNVIPAPHTTNSLLISSGTILLRPRRTSAQEEPGCFAIHKALLSAQSRAFFIHAYAHKHLKVFGVDADKHTLSHVILWLYYPSEYDLTPFSADLLLSIMAVALDIHIADLHNAIVAVLVDRHTGFSEFPLQTPIFAPQKSSLCRVYERSGQKEGIRALCAYLLALKGQFDYNAEVQWERELWKDIEYWTRKKLRLGRWEVMPASSFSMRDGKAARLEMKLDVFSDWREYAFERAAAAARVGGTEPESVKADTNSTMGTLGGDATAS